MISMFFGRMFWVIAQLGHCPKIFNPRLLPGGPGGAALLCLLPRNAMIDDLAILCTSRQTASNLLGVLVCRWCTMFFLLDKWGWSGCHLFTKYCLGASKLIKLMIVEWWKNDNPPKNRFGWKLGFVIEVPALEYPHWMCEIERYWSSNRWKFDVFKTSLWPFCQVYDLWNQPGQENSTSVWNLCSFHLKLQLTSFVKWLT